MDQTLFHLINEQLTHPALDLFMAALGDVEIWKPFLIVAVLLALFFARFKGRVCLLCLALTLGLCELVVNNLKDSVDRLRPKQAQSVRMVVTKRTSPRLLTLLERPTIRYSSDRDRRRSQPSFPSGHVASNVVIATVLTVFYPRRGWLYFIVAGLVAYSRVYLGAHWPSDVVATIFLGGGFTLISLGMIALLWRSVGPRWLPNVYRRHPHLVGANPT